MRGDAGWASSEDRHMCLTKESTLMSAGEISCAAAGTQTRTNCVKSKSKTRRKPKKKRSPGARRTFLGAAHGGCIGLRGRGGQVAGGEFLRRRQSVCGTEGRPARRQLRGAAAALSH